MTFPFECQSQAAYSANKVKRVTVRVHGLVYDSHIQAQYLLDPELLMAAST